MASREKKRTLFVFDFDLTLVDDNTDTWIMSICPELQIHENLRSLRRQFGCWTDLMDHVFSLISPHTSEEDILRHMRQLGVYGQDRLVTLSHGYWPFWRARRWGSGANSPWGHT